jgi:diadenosine tetraphosphate (Ap4A) HIT family hydrolase
MFRLHDKLAADTVEVARLELSRVQLMNDSRYPWLILVPAREGVTELHQLWDDDYQLLTREIIDASRILEKLHPLDKLNVGSLGNLVPQLHVHIVGRRREDFAWPGPVWGSGEAVPYEKAVLAHRLSEYRAAFEGGRGAARED